MIINFFLNRYVALGIGFLIMLICLKPDWVMKAVSFTGKMWWAENKLGRGGTFTVMKIIGILAPILAIIYFFSGGIHIDSEPAAIDEPYQYNQNY